MKSTTRKTTISLMLAVPDTPKAVAWYRKALGARVLWSLGSVAGLEIDGAPFFLHEALPHLVFAAGDRTSVRRIVGLGCHFFVR